MSSDIAIEVNHISKKFCKSFKYLLKYGMIDIGCSIFGIKRNINKLRKDEFWAIKDISFTLKKGETLGIIGSNGAGKTTLLKLLNGIFIPEEGEIKVRGKVGALISLGAGFHPLLTGRENIYFNGAILGMSKKEINEKFKAIVEFADIGDFLDTPVKNYSSGMYVRLGFAMAVYCNPEILLVDEVLAVGDLYFMAKCFQKIGELKKRKTSIVLISHYMPYISGFTDKVLYLKDGRNRYFGRPEEAINKYYKETFKKETKEKTEADRIFSGDKDFQVRKVEIKPNRKIRAGETLSFLFFYEAKKEIKNVELEITAYSSFFKEDLYLNEIKKNNLVIPKGKGVIYLNFKGIYSNNDILTFSIIFWREKRKGMLFWWRNIKVFFQKLKYASGKISVPIEIKIKR